MRGARSERQSLQKALKSRFRRTFGTGIPKGMKQPDACRELLRAAGQDPSRMSKDQLLRAVYKLAKNDIRAQAEPLKVIPFERRPAVAEAPAKAPTKAEKDAFYDSWDWRTLRMKILQRQGRFCACCGAKPGDAAVSGEPVRIVVDHIKSLHHHWHLRLDPSNLQVLCDECNQGKGAWDETDYRVTA